MRRMVESTQRQIRQLELKVDGTGTAALGGPAKLQGTLVDNGTGDYTITFAEPFAQDVMAVITMRTAETVALIAASSKTAIQVTTFAMDGTTATDADFDMLVISSEITEQY